MQQNKITILSTRPLSASVIDDAASLGIDVSVECFIDTAPIQSVEVQQEIEQALIQSATIVFTSMNAVEAVAEQMNDEQPDWMIYCIGYTTQQLAKKYFGENNIAGTADDASSLAQLIADEAYTDSVFFFCGDQRRDELPDILRDNDIEVNEIIVYQTIATPKLINKKYNGILFFSPSAVQSFFSINKIDKDTTLFAIGNTTKNTIKKYSNNNVLISDAPGKESLLQKAIAHFVNNEK